MWVWGFWFERRFLRVDWLTLFDVWLIVKHIVSCFQGSIIIIGWSDTDPIVKRVASMVNRSIINWDDGSSQKTLCLTFFVINRLLPSGLHVWNFAFCLHIDWPFRLADRYSSDRSIVNQRNLNKHCFSFWCKIAIASRWL